MRRGAAVGTGSGFRFLQSLYLLDTTVPKRIRFGSFFSWNWKKLIGIRFDINAVC